MKKFRLPSGMKFSEDEVRVQAIGRFLSAIRALGWDKGIMVEMGQTEAVECDGEVAFNLAEAASRPVPIRRVAAFIGDRNGTDCDTRSDPEAVALLIGLIDRHITGRRVKRLADITVAALGLILALPLMLVIAALIRLDSPGHPLLRQERLGQYRRPFTCLKFRTMCADAERLTGPVWASADDPRITRIGRFLRKSRLDELPQLVNVLRGDMSIVGPRPIRAFFADQLVALLPIYNLRFIEKPGLTGWAQINFGYPQTIEEQLVKFRLELEYIRRRTLWFDLLIMLRTLRVVAGMKGL
jgi:lipopolysaccharide/colanic/teichoic acid biosynthesis glycosyltransferase